MNYGNVKPHDTRAYETSTDFFKHSQSEAARSYRRFWGQKAKSLDAEVARLDREIYAAEIREGKRSKPDLAAMDATLARQAREIANDKLKM